MLPLRAPPTCFAAAAVYMALAAVVLAAIAALLCSQRAEAQEIVFTVQPSNTTVEAGTAFSLSCRAVLVSAPTTAVSYSWSREGEELNTTQQTLEFSAATEEVEGEYVCRAEVGGVSALSNSAFVTITQPMLTQREVNIIAISVSVGALVVILSAIVLFAWCSLCLHKRHIWDKAPARPRPPQTDPLLMEGGAEDSNTTAYSLKQSKRARSLNFLYSSSSTGLMEQAADLSTEQLLTASRPTDITSLEDDRDTLDFELDLDEDLFAQNPGGEGGGGGNRANSEGNLKSLASLKRHREGGLFKSASRRRASVESYSDVISEQSSEVLDETTSSLFNKSVRFDVEELADSGIVTGNSTPYHREGAARRSSEPEVKQTRMAQRRSSAPECNGSIAEESITKAHSTLDENVLAAASEAGEKDNAQNDLDEEVTFSETSLISSTGGEAPKKITRLISEAENWRASVTTAEPPAQTSASVTRDRVTEMRSKFLSKDTATDSMSEAKRTIRMSQLVSETTKLFLPQVSPAAPPTPSRRMKLKEFPVKQSDSEVEEEGEGSSNQERSGNPRSCDPPTGSGDPPTGSADPPTSSGDPTPGSCDATAEKNEEDELMESFFASRQAIMPTFSSPVGLSHWQPIQPPPLSETPLDGETEEREKEGGDEDELIEPLKLVTPGRGSTAVQLTPFGKSFVAPKAGPTQTARLAMREIRRSQQASGMEPFVSLQSYFRRKIATLSAIPEESPELQRSTHSMIQAQD